MKLSPQRTEVLEELVKPDTQLLFNIKGMVQIVRENEPYTFLEMGYGLVKGLKEKGLIQAVRAHQNAHVLQGELYTISSKGREALNSGETDG